MAHELTIRENGMVEMAYIGEVPWHADMTSPQELQPGASIEEWITGAGMDWEVRRAPVVFRPASQLRGYAVVADKHVLYRSDTDMPLGVVTSEYKEVQPRQIIEFFSDLYHTLGLELETAGTMFDGRRFFASAKLAENHIGKGDHIRGHLLATTSCDGTLRTTFKFVATRTVCNNTLTMALQENNAVGTVKVSHRSDLNVAEVKERLGIAPKTFETFVGEMRKLTKVKIKVATAEEMTTKLFPAMDGTNGPQPRVFKSVMDLFRGLATGDELPGTHGTAWGYLNAVTEHIDHTRTLRMLLLSLITACLE